MDELEIRRRLLTDPYQLEPEQRLQLKQDQDMLQFHQEVLDLDQQIRGLLSVAVPQDLEHSLLEHQHHDNQHQQKRFYQNLIALAASVAFLAGFALNWSFFLYGTQHLGDHSLAHVYHEEPYVERLKTPLSIADVNGKLAEFNAQFPAQQTNVLYANYCNFRGTRSLHLVLETTQGRLTVFVMPQQNSLHFDAEFQDDKYQGRSIAANKAIFVMVSDKPAVLQQGEQQLLKQLQFKV